VLGFYVAHIVENIDFDLFVEVDNVLA